jgi:hypothetical protein
MRANSVTARLLQRLHRKLGPTQASRLAELVCTEPRGTYSLVSCRLDFSKHQAISIENGCVSTANFFDVFGAGEPASLAPAGSSPTSDNACQI